METSYMKLNLRAADYWTSRTPPPPRAVVKPVAEHEEQAAHE